MLLHRGGLLRFLNVDLPLVIDNFYLLTTDPSGEQLRTQPLGQGVFNETAKKMFALRTTVDGGTVVATGGIMYYMEGEQASLSCILALGKSSINTCPYVAPDVSKGFELTAVIHIKVILKCTRKTQR